MVFQLYTGFTGDLRERIVKHNAGKVFSTRPRRPLECIYAEICVNEHDAKQREKYLKTGIGKRFVKQRLHHYFTSQPLVVENT
ncbi:MAG: GIY-YIG nuclease family protein [bacterium]|nr:GIY-YIG nuclease family protein [bacterium]MDZ4296125.1 GIY-YIG nuclease family protein [Patescibacteria group bacterium]